MSEEKPVILCVDDDPDVLNYLSMMLEREGYAFAGAESAEAGLEAYRRVQPDLLIVDLMMEEVDAGVGLVKELRLLGNRAPIFLLSSVGDNLAWTADYGSLGLAGVFQKPLQKEHLLSVVAAKLGEAAAAAPA